MKIHFVESEYTTSIELIPETLEETGQLLRAAKNTKQEKPNISFSFYRGSEMRLNLWMHKISKAKQDSRIKPGLK